MNAISPGPMKTLAGAAIGGARKNLQDDRGERALARQRHAGGHRRYGGSYLASDYGACTTGEIITVDGGYHILGMLQPENL